MVEHAYICIKGHHFSRLVKIGVSPPKEEKCAECGAEAYYNWKAKKIGATVAGGTGGGRKRKPHNP